jgi:hypothetical protein
MNLYIFYQNALVLNLPWIIFALCLGSAADTSSMLGIGGIVVQDNGTQPPFGSFIEIDCGDGFKKAAETTPSGTFFFQIDPGKKSAEFLVNAERNYGREAVPGFTPPAQPIYQNIPSRCELRAHLSGYHSSTKTVPLDDGRKIMDVGAVVLHSNAGNKEFDVNVNNLPQTDKKSKKKPKQKNK